MEVHLVIRENPANFDREDNFHKGFKKYDKSGQNKFG